MSSLVDLKNTFRQNRVPVTSSGGWFFMCGKDEWSMLDNSYCLNRVKVSKSEISDYIEMKRISAHKAKKITANIEEEEYASESN